MNQKITHLTLLLIIAHVPLAMVLKQYPVLSQAHAYGAVALALWFGVIKRSPLQVACMGAYLTGAEVLWRMTRAPIFWEFGKYAVALVFAAALLRMRPVKSPLVPILYFVLLLPSVPLAFLNEPAPLARAHVSFNLSGPLALMMSAWFFSNLQLTREALYRLFIYAIGPIVGIASLAVAGILTTADIRFSNDSNPLTSGGFGPNQVSAVLGLGALFALLCVLDSRVGRAVRFWLAGVMLLLATQSALTFSRGGLYNAAGAALLAFVYLTRDARSRMSLIATAAVLVIAGNFVLLPRLDEFTGGALTARFENLEMTNREEIAEVDLRIWAENPILGVGPGQAMPYRERWLRYAAAHTEFTRLPAEHGVFGIAALVLLLVAAVQNVRGAKAMQSKAVNASMLGWCFLFMADKAMRLAAPAFTFGLSFARFREDDAAVPAPAAVEKRHRRTTTGAAPFRARRPVRVAASRVVSGT